MISDKAQRRIDSLALITRLQQGGPEASAAAQELLALNAGLVRATVNRVARNDTGGLERDDLMQEASLALIRAGELFEPEKGNQFSTYAVTAMENALRRAVDKQGYEIRLPVSRNRQLRRLLYARDTLTANGAEVSPQALQSASGLSAQQLDVLQNLPLITFSLDDDTADGLKHLREVAAEEEHTGPAPDYATLMQMLSMVLSSDLLTVLDLYFDFSGTCGALTPPEIAARLGLEESVVRSRIEATCKILDNPYWQGLINSALHPEPEAE